MRHTVEQLLKVSRLHNRQEPFTAIAKRAGCTPGIVQRVAKKLKAGQPLCDAPRPGRSKVISEEGLKILKEMATSSACRSTRSIANQSVAAFGNAVSRTTVQKTLKKLGLKHGAPKMVLPLSDKQKNARVKFAQHHIANKTDFKRVMFTDSKMFELHKEGVKLWYEPGSRPTAPRVKHSPNVHVYLGVTWYGPTEPIFVAGGPKKRNFTSPDGKSAMRGVGAAEYNENVLPKLITDGIDLFAGNRTLARSWIFQQDNAPAHTAKMNKGFLNDHLPGRWIQDRPACSPDLSWIENVWAWAEHQLNPLRQSIQSASDPIAELQTAVSKILSELPRDMCQKCVASMMGRMQKVVSVGGVQIDK